MSREIEAKILIVDDEPDFLEVSKIQLARMDESLRITTATSAKEGLREIEGDGYDAVIADYKMPEINGLEFLKILRDEGNDIPFIVLTGKGREEVAMEALNKGANGYVMKGGGVKTQFEKLVHEIRRVVEKKRADEAFKEAKERFEELFEGANELIFTTDPEGNIKRVNRRVEEVLGYERKDLIGEDIVKIVHPEVTGIEGDIRHGGKVAHLIKGKTKDGDLVQLQMAGRSIQKGGKTVEIQYNAQDVTARWEAEELASKLLENVQVGIYILRDGKFMYANPQFEKLTGYSKEELIGRDSLSLVHPEDRERARNGAIRMLKGESFSPYHYRVITKGREMRRIVERVAPLFYRGKKAVIGSDMDITERK